MTTAIKQPTHADLAPKTTEQEARDVAEAAREKEWESPSFVRELFEGDFDLDLIHPFPEPDPADLAKAKPFMERLEKFMREKVDSDKIDREGKIPPEVIEELRQMGAFGIKIAEEYGGLGLSQYSYTKAIGLVTSNDGSMTALLSAAQSIGVPLPLKLFGTDGAEEEVPPAARQGRHLGVRAHRDATSAPTRPAWPRRRCSRADGSHYILNGEKLWCTNGTIAELMVVMARTGRRRSRAFIVEADWPGVEVVAAAPLHGAQGHRERRHPLHEREGAGGEHHLGRGQGPQARAGDAQHRAAHAAGLLRGGRQALRSRSSGTWAAERACSGARRSASTTRWPRSSAAWRPTPSPWRR